MVALAFLRTRRCGSRNLILWNFYLYILLCLVHKFVEKTTTVCNRHFHSEWEEDKNRDKQHIQFIIIVQLHCPNKHHFIEKLPNVSGFLLFWFLSILIWLHICTGQPNNNFVAHFIAFSRRYFFLSLFWKKTVNNNSRIHIFLHVKILLRYCTIIRATREKSIGIVLKTIEVSIVIWNFKYFCYFSLFGTNLW